MKGYIVEPNLAPVIVDFESFRDVDRIASSNMDKVATSMCRAVGFIEHEDGDLMRLVYRLEGTKQRDPEYCAIVIPKDAIWSMGLSEAVEIIDYLDHGAFNFLSPRRVRTMEPWHCTAYGIVEEETDEFVRLVHYERKDNDADEPRQDGMVVLKSVILSRETFGPEVEEEGK